jgi:hypothetical protein
MQAEWSRLMHGLTENTLDRAERAHAKKFAKAVRHLQDNPAHPGLQSHEIDALSARYGLKVYESYLENRAPGAARIFWVYGPERHYITVIGIEPHPEDAKRDAYARIQLSQLPRIELASTADKAAQAGSENTVAGRESAPRRSRKNR